MSDEEDYMSSAFLAKVEDVKPGGEKLICEGVSAGREGRRLLRIDAHREQVDERQRMEAPKSKDELEKNRLIEGLSQPIRAESKGFQLLAKMGYKEGMSLGRSEEGALKMDSRTKEPISIQVRTDRSGVGMDEHRREKQRDLCEAHMKRMKRNADIEDALACDFRRRKRSDMKMKQLIGEIQKLRKTCQEMDTRLAKRLPDEFWFWPIYSRDKELVEEEADESDALLDGIKRTKRELPEEEQKDQVERYTYANGEEALMGMNLYELDDQSLEKMLATVITYMRKEHLYCLYCGCAFSSSEEMDNECPGTTREDHE